MLKSFANKNMAVIVRNEKEDELFITQCKMLNIKYTDRDAEDYDMKYPVAYFVEENANGFEIEWLDFLNSEHPVYKSNFTLFLYDSMVPKD